MGARRVHASARSLLWPRRVIIEKYYQRLTLDFDTNKRICEEVAIIQSKRLRNKIAGFTTVSIKPAHAPLAVPNAFDGAAGLLKQRRRPQPAGHAAPTRRTLPPAPPPCLQHLMKRIQRGPVRGISLKLQVGAAHSWQVAGRPPMAARCQPPQSHAALPPRLLAMPSSCLLCVPAEWSSGCCWDARQRRGCADAARHRLLRGQYGQARSSRQRRQQWGVPREGTGPGSWQAATLCRRGRGSGQHTSSGGFTKPGRQGGQMQAGHCERRCVPAAERQLHGMPLPAVASPAAMAAVQSRGCSPQPATSGIDKARPPRERLWLQPVQGDRSRPGQPVGRSTVCRAIRAHASQQPPPLAHAPPPRVCRPRGMWLATDHLPAARPPPSRACRRRSASAAWTTSPTSRPSTPTPSRWAGAVRRAPMRCWHCRPLRGDGCRRQSTARRPCRPAGVPSDCFTTPSAVGPNPGHTHLRPCAQLGARCPSHPPTITQHTRTHHHHHTDTHTLPTPPLTGGQGHHGDAALHEHGGPARRDCGAGGDRAQAGRTGFACSAARERVHGPCSGRGWRADGGARVGVASNARCAQRATAGCPAWLSSHVPLASHSPHPTRRSAAATSRSPASSSAPPASERSRQARGPSRRDEMTRAAGAAHAASSPAAAASVCSVAAAGLGAAAPGSPGRPEL